MLKNRLIAVLYLKNGFLVRSEGFDLHQRLGNPVAQVTRYNAWDVDELIYIDISRKRDYDLNRDDLGGVENARSIEEIIPIVAKKCFMPLTFGGWIRTLDDISLRMSLGADKVTINTQALADPEFITAAAQRFGSQAIVVSIDALCHEDGRHEVFSGWGKEATGRRPEEWAMEAEERGAGEIFINSIDRDGSAKGYDLELIRKVTEVTGIPVIACGGVGRHAHFKEGLEQGGASAVAAGNIFNFKEMSYVLAKRYLRKDGLNVR